ncbi:glycoside hydrolase family 78 protein [Dothidotthia symphoricarpi CBS 119687]|uniref:Glycoside hydrolase family 78 protein n=1 Tax=Dothidotthia symphoricarpi CBS 119687 TaxID=1392245 RepID=A0A6A6AQF0_9PLEO|nr:glycoside hydrolase family 78 protein [Dothidotthia symphoricarpi CBS 119687]KAF2133077.1 glycoside hydrolase family 78 protein [Dothidotthia symphoricarpi CBS 119687]
MRLLSAFPLLSLVAPAISIPYEQYILTPKTRTLQPVSVHSSNGSVSDPESLLGSSGSSVFEGVSATAYDFGINIAGVVMLTVGGVCGENQTIGVTFSESSFWVSNKSSDATADAGKDETLWFQIDGPGQYTAPKEKQRGGFRYMTLVHNTTGSVEVTAAEVYYTPMPHWEEEELGNYTGYFHCDDELLNRIWYAGAYTNEMCTISPSTGNALVHLGNITSAISDAVNVTWYYNYTISNGTSVLVDGAKRDRLVWAGDMAIAVPGVVVSTNDVVSIENSINSLFAIQNTTTGQLPYAGRPFFSILSFTYHLYTLIGVADHYLYTGDITYLQSLWPKWKLGLNFSLSFIDSTGLANVTSAADWLRFGMGGHNIEANSILYNTINQGIALATALNDTGSISNWSTIAGTIKTAANALLWDEGLGMYTDNETTILTPQDGNSWAVVANITQNSSQIDSISSRLVSRWTPYGAPAPEAGATVSPFISGFELQAHMLASNASAALALMRLQWGFMLDDPRMTNSTFIEGYSTTGELHYAPYKNDARISHAHGWATGPTSSLTFYVAGIQLLTAGGATWRIAPEMGDLKEVDAGFSTKVGFFSAKTSVSDTGLEMEFETPEGTTGEVHVPSMGCAGSLEMLEESGKVAAVVMEVKDTAAPVVVAGLQGGTWKVTFACAA